MRTAGGKGTLTSDKRRVPSIAIPLQLVSWVLRLAAIVTQGEKLEYVSACINITVWYIYITVYITALGARV